VYLLFFGPTKGFWREVFAANVLGLVISAFYAFRRNPDEQFFGLRCLTKDTVDSKRAPSAKEVQTIKSRGPLARFFFGTEFNPRHPILGSAPGGGGELDVKMFLYIAGAVNCQVLIVNYAAYDITASSNMSSGETPFTAGKLRLVVAVPLFCLTWFCMEYLYFEHIHLYTYDLFAERVGFKNSILDHALACNVPKCACLEGNPPPK